MEMWKKNKTPQINTGKDGFSFVEALLTLFSGSFMFNCINDLKNQT